MTYSKMKNDERISVGLKYHNRLNHKEIVQIYGLDSKQMWGQNGKEDVIIVLYEVLSGTLGELYTLSQIGKTTQDNFIMKYIGIDELRDNKINQILGE